jgi:hypothetical protein
MVLTNAANVAGQFTSDWDSGPPSGTSLYGRTSIGGGRVLKLMTNGAADSFGDLVIDNFSGDEPVTAFLASFDLLLSGRWVQCPTCVRLFPSADGFSFNFATNFYRPTAADGRPLREDGFTNGLSVGFDTFDSRGDNDPNDTAPAIEVKVFGRQIAFQSMAGGTRFGSSAGPLLRDPLTGQPLTLDTDSPTEIDPVSHTPVSHFAPVIIELKVDGTLWVTYKGVLVLSNVQTTLPPIVGGQFAFAARTGEAYENVWIDNLGIQSFAALTVISSYARLDQGFFQLRFSGVPGTGYTVLGSTNLIDWSGLGPATETAAGQFEFTDTAAPNHPTRFYQLRSP